MGETAAWTRVGLASALGATHQLDLLTASYRRHAFARHTHTTYAIGVVTGGEEQFHYRGALRRAGVGTVAVLEPEEPHDGMATRPEGWAYRVLYPSAALLFEGRDPVRFREPIVDDPRTVHLVRSAHEELTAGVDPLAAHSRLAWAFEALIRRHGDRRVALSGDLLRARDTAGARKVAAIRDRLLADLRCAPSLRELADGVELSPFHMLRVFRDATGFPPHAWLVLERVCRARCLLAAGRSPADVAGAVGFADQAHLTRWFKRVTGVTPAAFRNSVQDAARRSA